MLETVPTAHGGVTALCYSSDGLRALSGGEDGRLPLRVWRVEDDAAKARGRSEPREVKFETFLLLLLPSGRT